MQGPPAQTNGEQRGQPLRLNQRVNRREQLAQGRYQQQQQQQPTLEHDSVEEADFQNLQRPIANDNIE